MNNQKEHNFPSMNDLYNRKTGAKSFQIGNGDIFVNFNRRMEPFIRVNIYPDKSRTFPFTKREHKQATEFFQEEVTNE
jgi:chromosome condensin MukBEF complex kleisin-like MukF subunit